MLGGKSSTPGRPLVVYLTNSSAVPGVDRFDYLHHIEAKFGIRCSIVDLEGRGSTNDPAEERARTTRCFNSLKEKIQVRVLCSELMGDCSA